MKPIIAITMGDPAGIGPEIGIRALVHPEVLKVCRPLLIGLPGVIRGNMKTLGISKKIQTIEDPGKDRWASDSINLVPLSGRYPFTNSGGRPSPEGGLASVEAVRVAADLTEKNLSRAMVTGPVNKAAINSAGLRFQGHTEFLAERFGVSEFGMIMVVPPEREGGSGLRVMLSTTHIALRQVPSSLSAEKLLNIIRLGHSTLKERFSIPSARIGVAGLNPHGGEGGLFGNEEETIIRPAVEKARAEEIPVSGPFPSDTLFRRAVQGEFDLVIAMYHDQALIPVKLLGFHRSVNFTAGLPVIRTSVDHGTAYDLAGKGQADPGSLVEAIRLAARLNPVS